jgi:Tol biopolymer transport system component
MFAAAVTALMAAGLLSAIAIGFPSSLVIVSRSDGPKGKANDASAAGTISPSGRFATFVADGGLDGPEGPETFSLYLRDLKTGHTRNLGFDDAGAVFSANGQLAYSEGGNVFVADLATGSRASVTKRVVQPRRGEWGGSSGRPSISANGRYVVFESSVQGLVDEDHDHKPDSAYPAYQVYLWNAETRKVRLISRADGPRGRIGDAESSQAMISANGRYVVFTSDARNLIAGAPTQRPAIFVRDLRTERTRLVSNWQSKPGPHRSDASHPSISASGRYVAFQFIRFGAPASIVVRDIRTGHTVNASLLTRNPLNLDFGAPALSSNGRFVAFKTGVRDGGGHVKLYLVDLSSRHSRFVHSVGAESRLTFSRKGRYLLFDTYVPPDVGTPGSPQRLDTGSEGMLSGRGQVFRYLNPFVGSG